MQAWMLSEKSLNGSALVNGRMIPHEDDWATPSAKQMLEISDHFFARQIATIGPNAKSDFAFTRRNDQSTDHVETIVMLQTCADGRRLPSRRPSTLERRYQAEATFVHENKARAELTPLFLSAASGSAANGQSRRHRVVRRDAGVSGNSTAGAVTDAKPHWASSAPRTVSLSDERSDPVSNSQLHSRGLEHPGAGVSRTVSIAARINDTDAREEAWSIVCACRVWLRLATIAPPGASRRAVGPLWSALCLGATGPSHDVAAPLSV